MKEENNDLSKQYLSPMKCGGYSICHSTSNQAAIKCDTYFILFDLDPDITQTHLQDGVDLAQLIGSCDCVWKAKTIELSEHNLKICAWTNCDGYRGGGGDDMVWIVMPWQPNLEDLIIIVIIRKNPGVFKE